MIKITNKIDGKKYVLVPRGEGHDCSGCSLKSVGEYSCLLPWAEALFNNILVCSHLDGIWKEVNNAD